MSEARMEMVPVEKVNERKGERIRTQLNEEKLESLMQSMSKIGQLQPILLDSEYNLIAGGRRLEAIKRLGKTEIEAKIVPIELIIDNTMSEIDENEEREAHSFSESLRIYSILMAKHGKKKRGRKSQVADYDENIIRQNSAELPTGVVTLDWIAKKIKKFNNKFTLQQALAIIENDKTEGLVIDDLDNNRYSINYAFKICQEPKSRQLTMRNEAVNDAETNVTEFNKSQKQRRKAKRKEKNNIPTTHTPHPIFNIIRIAPDWDKTAALPDVLDLPVNDYASDKIAVIAVECYARHLPGAMQCLDNWDFDYVTMLTVWDPKRTAGHLNFTNSDTAHIIFGMRRGSGDVGEVFRLAQIVKTAPVHARYTTSLSDSLIHIIDELFPDKADKRIDMTSDTKSKGWICWKISYGTPKDPETEGGPDVDDPNYLPQDMPSIEPVDEPDVSVEPELTEDDQPETDEADIEDFIDVVEPKKPLRIF